MWLTTTTIVRQLRTVVALAVLLMATAARAQEGVPPVEVRNGAVLLADTAPTLGISCARDTDATAILRSTYESDGTNPGGRLYLPSRCVVLLGTPGAGGAVVELPSFTTIECADKTAGFALARRYCSGGDTPGGACSSDDHCPGGGACVYDAGGSEFAPVEGETYTVFKAAQGSTGVAVRNCSIWANQASGDFQAMGGLGRAWGYCDGGTSNGAACAQVCDEASGILAGALCASDAACSAGTCLNTDHCVDGGGTCRQYTWTQKHGASGPGNIIAIDTSAGSRFELHNVSVYDLRTSPAAIELGTEGDVMSVVVPAGTLNTPILGGTWLNFGLRSHVDVGVRVRPDTIVANSRAAGWTASYEMIGGSGGGVNGPTVSDSLAKMLGAPSEPTWPGTVGFMFSGAGGIAKFNRIGTFIGGMCKYGGGCNFPFFMGNHADFVTGPLWQVGGPHNNVQFNRKAWGGKGTLLGFGEFRGRCAGGTRSGLICLAGAGTDAGIGCPSSSCEAHEDFPGGGGGHFQVTNNFLHSDQTALEGYIAVSPWKRCAGGSEVGAPCTTDGDCDGGGTCAGIGFPIGTLNDNELYNVLGGGDGIDLDSPALNTPGLSAISVAGNVIQMQVTGSPVGIRMPSTSANAVHMRLDNLIVGATNEVLNWTDSMGTLIRGPGTMDSVSATDGVNLTSGVEATVLTLPDYDNSGRSTKLEAVVQVNAASGSTRDFTARLKLEGSTVATALMGGVPGAKSATIPLTWVDTVSASGRSATVTIEVATTGTTSSASNRALTRVTN